MLSRIETDIDYCFGCQQFLLATPEERWGGVTCANKSCDRNGGETHDELRTACRLSGNKMGLGEVLAVSLRMWE